MKVNVGVLGAGTVGGALVQRLLLDRIQIREKTGVDLELKVVAVKHLEKPRSFELPPERITDQAMSVVSSPGIDVVVEAIGGLEPTGELLLTALRSGKPVVTANKELVATRGEELFEAANRSGVPLMYEAAVGGGIPVIRPLAESLAGERIDRVSGIVNGTTNYILTSMAQDGRSFKEALEEATALGYAEPDPSDDISGRDAAFKTAILARLAFGEWVAPWQVECLGIEAVSRADVEAAALAGKVIKLIGVAERVGRDISTRVSPIALDVDHPLAGVDGVTNAIFVEGPAIGRLLFTGPGAGGQPTASALLGDLIQVASRRNWQGKAPSYRRPRQVLHR
jgi:homoserine dehydrogenase